MIETQLRLAGCQCSVVEWNPGGSILVFAFHGWLDNLASFESLIEFMPEIHLVAIDFPGHGHSEHLPEGYAYHFIDGLYLIDDLLNHYQVSKAFLLGHSMGGAVSTLYAAACKQKVSGLVLIESIGPLTVEPEQSVELLSSSVNQRSILSSKKKPVYQSFAEALSVRATASEISEIAIKPIVERALSHVDGGYTWRADPRLRVTSALRMSEAQLACTMQKISAPVLLIEAENGLLKNRVEVDARKTVIQSLQVCRLPGGHHVHLEHPQNVGEQIQQFFYGLKNELTA